MITGCLYSHFTHKGVGAGRALHLPTSTVMWFDQCWPGHDGETEPSRCDSWPEIWRMHWCYPSQQGWKQSGQRKTVGTKWSSGQLHSWKTPMYLWDLRDAAGEVPGGRPFSRSYQKSPEFILRGQILYTFVIWNSQNSNHKHATISHHLPFTWHRPNLKIKACLWFNGKITSALTP